MFQSLKKCFLTRHDLAISGNIFGCHNWGGTTGLYRVEARDTVKYPALCRTALCNKELVGQKSHSPKVEKPRPQVI